MPGDGHDNLTLGINDHYSAPRNAMDAVEEKELLCFGVLAERRVEKRRKRKNAVHWFESQMAAIG
jgi:hypothetical protein